MTEIEAICPISNKECDKYPLDDHTHHCNCDEFGPVIPFKNNGINDENRHIISGYLYETRNRSSVIKIDPENVEKILSDPLVPKKALDKFNKLLLTYYKLNGGLGFFDQNVHPAVAYVTNPEDILSMVDALIKEGYLTHYQIRNGRPANCFFTLKGLEYCESLLSRNQSKTVFVAMKFSDEMRSLHENAIKPACKECGFTALTVDETEHNEDITDKIITEIKTSHFVVADFTENNLGVYYEAGYAKGLGLPVIKICKKKWFDETDDKGKKINMLHFDIEHDNLILWENEEDLKERLVNRIKATIL